MNEIKICQNCQHWEREEYGNTKFGNCKKASKEEDDDTMMIANGAYAAETWFNTRQDFGCVLFKTTTKAGE